MDTLRNNKYQQVHEANESNRNKQPKNNVEDRQRRPKNVTCGKQNFCIAHMLCLALGLRAIAQSSSYSSISSDYFSLELENSTQPTHSMQMISFPFISLRINTFNYNHPKYIILQKSNELCCCCCWCCWFSLLFVCADRKNNQTRQNIFNFTS